jgi:AcrR family transcriptional regulator
MKKRKPAQPPDRTARERILHTAHDLFYREGIRATGIDRIIEEAGVTKVTLYRHFASKNDLIAAYLEYRHAQWMAWFEAALAGSTKNAKFPLEPVLSALREWFSDNDYRGCAFINGVVELDGTLPRVTEVSIRHKQDMAKAIERLLPAGRRSARTAQAAAMAVDGAIIHVQMQKSAETALGILELLLRALY